MPSAGFKTTTRNLLLMLMIGLVGYGCDLGFSEQDSMQQAAADQATGNHRAAIIELKKVLKHNPANKEARVLLAKSYLETEQAASAEKELGFARKLGVPLADIADLWGRMLLLKNEYKRVLQEVPLSLGTSPRQKAALMLVHGYANAALDNKSTAKDLFHKVKSSGLLQSEANVALALYAMEERDSDSALKLTDEAIAADESSVAAWMLKARILMETQSLQQAGEAFEKAVRLAEKQGIAEKEFQARVYLVQIALAQNNPALARKKVDSLVLMAPEHPLSLYLSAVVDYQQKNYKRAQVSLEKVLARVPNDLRSLLLLGATHFAQNSLEQANRYLSQFVENVPTHIQGRKLLAAVRMKLGQPQDALAALEPITDSTQDAELLTMIGRASVLTNNPLQAEQYYKRAQSSNPENQLLKRELANVYLKRGSIDQAIEELQSITGNERADAQKMLVYAHLRKQDFVAARRVVKDILQREGDKPATYTLAGLVELSAGNRLSARDYFKKSLQLNTDFVPGILLLARMDYEDDILDSAKSGFEKVLEIDEKNIHAMLGLSAVAGRENDTRESLMWLRMAKDKNPGALVPTLVLAQYYLKTGHPSPAINLLQDYAKNAKDKTAVMPLLVSAHLQAGQKNDALSAASRFVKDSPALPAAHLFMARVQLAMGNEQDAEKSLTRSLELEPAYLQGNIALASLKLKQGKYRSAQQIADRLKQHYPQYAVGPMLEGEIFLKQKQYTQAIKTLSAAYQQHALSAPARKLASVYSLADKNPEAIQVLETWTEKHPQDLSARLDLAVYYAKANRMEKAREQYHAILEQAPENVAALNNIALAYRDKDADKALAYAEKAYELQPDLAAVKDTLGWVLLATGENRRAQSLLAEASGQSEDPSILYHYAVALHETGSHSQAGKILRGLLDSSVIFPEKAQATKLYDSLASSQ